MVVEAVIVVPNVLNVQDVQVVTVAINVQIAKLAIHNAIQIISYLFIGIINNCNAIKCEIKY